MKKFFNNAFTFGIFILAAFVLIRAVSPMLFPAQTPEVFAAQASFNDALDKAKATGKPVFAVFSASWCPPCQGYKRGALADDKVAQWLEANTVPVYVDVDEQPNAARKLDVSSIPATFMLSPTGEVSAKAVGPLSTKDLLGWLDSNKPKAIASN